MKHPWLILSGYVLALAAATTAIRIEWLNAQAGGVLPSREFRDNNPADGVVKWRKAPADEKYWRMTNLPPADGDRDLTEAERTKMNEDIRRNAARNSLRDAIEYAGLVQYPLVVILGVFSLALWKRCHWRIAAPVATITLVCAVLMFYRGYFSSLGP